ncbi:MAG: Arylsulfatase [candidate division BRC1 bacterium ADurb.BinA364]|nr:MAG: Arylsulfatase [candidate division BRC1 bacterium ADurb.BinA364]
MIAKYYGMVKCIDDNVGKILDALKAEGVMENTIVVFTADHGDLCGEHARDNKGVPYEGSAKIPFILYYPAKIEAGTVVPQALGCLDFAPTILGLMGVDSSALKTEGRDASALFLGAPPRDWKDVAIFRIGRGNSGYVAAATARYKFIVSAGDEPWLLDLREDPEELNNLFHDPARRDVVRALGAELLAYCQTQAEPHWENPLIQADLKWCAEGQGEYPGRPKDAPPAEEIADEESAAAKPRNAAKKAARKNANARK